MNDQQMAEYVELSTQKKYLQRKIDWLEEITSSKGARQELFICRKQGNDPYRSSDRDDGTYYLLEGVKNYISTDDLLDHIEANVKKAIADVQHEIDTLGKSI